MIPRRRLLVGIAILGLAALSALAAILALGRYQPDPARYPVRGVDVSHHQESIDWRAVAADHVSFAYLKASEGKDHRDSLFADNWRRARAAGLAVGAYHYFTLCSSGRAQAANFLAAVPDEPSALPMALDLEFGGNCGARPSGADLRRQLDIFLAMVEARDGKRAVLYLTPEFLAAYGPNLPDRPLWRRSILHHPDAAAPWTIWQYHSRGQVKGVSGPVDLNVFNGNSRAFARFARPD